MRSFISGGPVMSLLFFFSACAPASPSTPSGTAPIVREFRAGISPIAWPGAESRSLASDKFQGGPSQDAQGFTNFTAAARLSIVEQLQPAGASVSHRHESEFIYGLDGSTTVEWSIANNHHLDVVGPGVASSDTAFASEHTHRNGTAAAVRWYGIRFIGPSSLAPETFPSSRTVYLSPPIEPGPIAAGHVAELRLLTMTAGAQTPRQRPTFVMVVYVLAGTVDAVRDAAATRLASGEGALVQFPQVVRFVAGADGARMLIFYANADSSMFVELVG